MPELSYGSTDSNSGTTPVDAVTYFQEILNGDYVNAILPDHPYQLYPLLIEDGIVGQLTENAVKDFQTAKGLQSDGIVGPLTWYALDGCGASGGGPL